MAEPTVTRLDVVNQLLASFKSKDEERAELMNKILNETECITDTNVASQDRYNKIESVEYILFRLRLDVEFEHLKVKGILNDRETDPSVRSIFMKRDQFLANHIVKLNNIRDDLATLQKVVYTKSSFNFNKS